MMETKNRTSLSCYVLMPFGGGEEYHKGGEESAAIFSKFIKIAALEAAQKAGVAIEISRESDRSNTGQIPVHIVRNIAEADIAIIDLTGRNPNVFLELGIRYSLCHSGTILISQNAKSIPFNIHAFRTVIYSTDFWDNASSMAELTNAISAIIADKVTNEVGRTKSDSLVYDAFPNLQVSLNGSDQTERASDTLSWAGQWSIVAKIADEFGALIRQGSYVPDAIVSMTNGGLFFADSISRKSYHNEIPFLTLWAKRTAKRFFSHLANHGFVMYIKSLIDESRLIERTSSKVQLKEILVIDDIVGSGATIDQLINFFDENFPAWKDFIKVRLLFFFGAYPQAMAEYPDLLLISDARFSEIKNLLPVNASYTKLPYDKSIPLWSRGRSDSDRDAGI